MFGAWPAIAADDPPAIEFFEKEVRPLLVRRCFECHGPEAKRLEGGLLMNGHKSLLEGGDTGPAIEPGRPDESLLIDAITYEGDYEMPPKGKMPDEEIALLKKWVAMGAPWPESSSSGPDPREKFDLAARKQSHWAWQPIRDPEPPNVNAKDWPLDPLDHFILARLETEGLKPNGPAAPQTLIRRLYFDLIGLPPAPEAVARWSAKLKQGSENGAVNQQALSQLVDELLASPHFGERWGRHWLDLMRYAESRGHEFDYNAPNAWEYRDYVIRAFNADVPYDQFVTEHVAGDLLPEPRRNPDEGFNESIIGTGFWHLGEWVHSPVDTRQDECDRLDNQIDVFGKTFLGMTIACARCHDHKFDAISQRDYYALAGYVQSSAYRLARFETLDHNRQIAQKLDALRKSSGKEIAGLTAKAQRPVVEQADKYLLAAREAIITPVSVDRAKPQAADISESIVFADFEDGTYNDWKIEGPAFGDKPVSGTLPRQQQVSGWQGKFYINTYIGGDGTQGKAVSPAFKVSHRYITMLIGGGSHQGQTCVNLIVGEKVVRTATGKDNERLEPLAWDVADLIGQQARIEIVDAHTGGWGHVNVDHIVFTDDAKNVASNTPLSSHFPQAHIEAIAQKQQLDAKILSAWIEQLAAAKENTRDPLHLWARLAFDSNQGETHLQQHAAAALRELKQRATKFDQQSGIEADVIIDFNRLAPGEWMADGSAFGVGPTQVGEPVLTSDSDHPLAGFVSHGAARRDLAFKDLKLAPGAMNDHGRAGQFQREGQSIGTPTFTVKDGPVHYLVRGAGRAFAVVDSHRLVQGPLHGEVLFQWNDDPQDRPRWLTHNLARHKGHRIHIEFRPKGDGPLEILQVAQGPRPSEVPVDAAASGLLAKHLTGSDAPSLVQLASGYQKLLEAVNGQIETGLWQDASAASDTAVMADWIAKHPAMFIDESSEEAAKLRIAARQFASAEKELASQIKTTSRLAMAMWDGFSEDEELLIRGNHGSPNGTVPRRLLTALGGTDADSSDLDFGSGRLALAEKLIDPANPLTSRVMVNRIWHHLTGVGIVPTPDNFGVLGLEPTHPHLLDHLAMRFVRTPPSPPLARGGTGGWSVKRMIKEIVLSRTYQMSSHPSAADEQDPSNTLLHRMRIRRLQSEVIRDAMLTISGRIDDRMFGQPVPVHLTAFMTGRGRPGQGPLDGNGRRSIYISIRRNFLSPMMLAFDMPQPSAPMGRRTVSNVPAQALIMMNDPLVVQQAEVWAKRLLEQPDLSPEERVELMYQQAFARTPSEEESTAALGFLNEQASRYGIAADEATSSLQTWADLCHVMFNVKEFIFVN